jgi:hypothetical protein
LDNAGSNIEISSAMIAITTRSSTSVKPTERDELPTWVRLGIWPPHNLQTQHDRKRFC